MGSLQLLERERKNKSQQNMDIDQVDSNQVILSFANVLKDYQVTNLKSNASQDPFTIVREFRSIVGETALQLANVASNEDRANYENWELEAKLWHLIDLLESYRTADEQLEKITTYPYNSDVVFKKELLQNNKDLYEIWLIMVWIQSNAKPPSRPNDLPSSKWSNTVTSGGLKSCDLDYPLRDNTVSIDPRDTKADHTFYRYIYQLILAGSYDEVRKECEFCDNLTLNMIICGLDDYIDPQKDTQIEGSFTSQQGIKKHALWRRSVYSLSLNPNLDKYEAAIYSYLAGDIPNSTEAEDRDWSVELLLYLNQIWQICIENYLTQQGRINAEELIVKMPSQPLSLQDTLNIVSSQHQFESEHPIRVLMGAVILNNVSSVIGSSVEMLLDVVKGIETNNDLFDEPYLLRIVTHLAIFIDMICPNTIDEADKSRLITAYVTILSLYELYETVPVYISFLNKQESEEAYSFFLSNLVDSDVREKQLQLSNFLQLPTANILRRTAQRIFADTEQYYNPETTITVNYDISDIDRRLMSGAEWLLEGKLYADAIDSIIALSRRFLINGKIKSLEHFFNRNDLNEIIKHHEMDKLASKSSNEEDLTILEIKQYQNLLQGFKKYEEWKKSSSLFNSQSNLPTLVKQFKEFSNGIYQLIKDFLVYLSEDERVQDKEALFEIRALYTPYLVIELHKSLVSASESLKISSFINEALNLTNLVANETDKIYLLFQSSGRLKEYLQLIARSATLLAH